MINIKRMKVAGFFWSLNVLMWLYVTAAQKTNTARKRRAVIRSTPDEKSVSTGQAHINAVVANERIFPGFGKARNSQLLIPK